MTELQFLAILDKLLEKHDEASRRWLLDFFDKPENLPYFSLVFSSYVTKKIPELHRDLYDLYQEDGFKAGAAPRGFAKSTITDLIFIAWRTLTGKSHFVILVSDTYTQSTMLIAPLRDEIETNPILRWLYPQAQGEIWSNENIQIRGFDIEKKKMTDSLVIPKGAGMKIRGLRYKNWRPDLIVIDDLENDETVASADQREKLKKWLLRAVIPALAKNGQIIMIGTILHFDSLLQNIISHKGEFASWKTRFFQALTNGVSIWEEQSTTQELIDMRDNPQCPRYIGALTFSQEMQNVPLDDGQRIIQTDWLNQRFKLAEMELQYRRDNPTSQISWVEHFFKEIITGVDPAISKKETADWWAMITVGVAKETGHLYLLDYFRVRENDPLKQVQFIFDNYKQWKPDKIKIEAVAYQAGLYHLTKNEGAKQGIYLPVHTFKPDKDKIRRATIQSAMFSGGLVHLREDHPLFTSFYSEIVEFPLGTHDDMFDAFLSATEETIKLNQGRTFARKATGF